MVVRIGVTLGRFELQPSNGQRIGHQHERAGNAEADDRTVDDERTVVQGARTSTVVVRDDDVALVCEAKDENRARNGNGEGPDDEYGEKGLAFASLAAAKRPRDVKEPVDGEHGQMPDRRGAEKNVEEDEQVAE